MNKINKMLQRIKNIPEIDIMKQEIIDTRATLELFVSDFYLAKPNKLLPKLLASSNKTQMKRCEGGNCFKMEFNLKEGGK